MIIEILRQQLRDDVLAGSHWCVALSGGVDSTVLLHAMAQLVREFSGNALRAMHVNHHLHADADGWAAACQAQCDELGVGLICCDVTVGNTDTDGLEAAARKVRYQALIRLLHADERLLTAHHRDDQIETVLLRLLRGTGAHGLAGIRPHRSCGKGWLLRPLLEVGRDALERYACEHHLAWIEDPTNTDTTLDRNFLRHQIVPQLRERWPGLGETLPRAARLNGEMARMLDELAEQDIGGAGRGGDDTLSIDVLRHLSAARQRNAVRYWLRRRCGFLPPSEARLREGLEQLLNAGADRLPLLEWGGMQIRRYRERLYVLAFDPSPVGGTLPETCCWDGRGRITLGPPRGALRFVRADESNVDVPHDWVVRFRVGGERFATGRQHKTVKNLFQEKRIVPWMRGHVPLLYRADHLVAVGDLWQAEDISGGDGENGVQIVWDAHPAVH